MNTKQIKKQKPTHNQLNRKIITDSIGTSYVVGTLSKEDLQILVCLLDDDLQEARQKLEHYEQGYNGGKGV
jgi:hypothetical protein